MHGKGLATVAARHSRIASPRWQTTRISGGPYSRLTAASRELKVAACTPQYYTRATLASVNMVTFCSTGSFGAHDHRVGRLFMHESI